MKYPKYLEKGMRFGRWIVIEVDEDSKVKNGQKVGPSIWEYVCKCDCGNIGLIYKSNLIEAKSESCGCLRIEVNSKIKGNKINVYGSYIKIFLSNSDKFTIIDRSEFNTVKDFTWRLSFNGYAITKVRSIRLHRLIMNCPKGKDVDHRDHNLLDNRKQNLRLVTRSQNTMNSRISKSNTSGYKGVVWIKSRNKWQAQIGLNRKNINLGRFVDIRGAIKARKEAEIKYFGEYRHKGN